MLRTLLNKSWKQYPTKQQLYAHLPPVSQSIQVRQTRNAGYCCNAKNGPINKVFQWAPRHQICAYTGYLLEDLQRVMHNWDE